MEWTLEESTFHKLSMIVFFWKKQSLKFEIDLSIPSVGIVVGYEGKHEKTYVPTNGVYVWFLQVWNDVFATEGYDVRGVLIKF